MTQAKTLLVTGALLSLLVPSAGAAALHGAPMILAQADTTDTTASALAAVEAARSALRAALASGQGIDETRQALRDALQALEAARVAAGLPATTNPADLEPVLPEESAPPAVAPPPAEPPPAPVEAPPPAEPPPAPAETPPPAEPPPAEVTPPTAPAQEQPPAAVEPPAAEPVPPAEPAPPPAAEPPPPAAEPPPPAAEPAPPPPAAEPPPPAAEPAPAAPPAVETPPPAGEVAPPAVDQPVTPSDQQPPPADQPPAPPSAEQQPPAAAQPPVVEPVVDLPPPVVDTPPPPPPAATEGAFDLQKFKTRPKFGEAPPPAAATTATKAPPPPPVLPQSENAVREGAVLAAPDGRVIVKEGGQVTVRHDDSGRFVRQGDRFRTAPSDNDTETTTVSRPDGTEIVTVRDRSGDIIQRYRKNQNGSVEVLIGEVENPGFIGRIFGQRPRPAAPRPQPRPVLNLQLGPVQINIPRQDYIVESSRANERQFHTTLMAPPVERVERVYTLEEIRYNGRLRDKVRRIDFDTITFDTGQATVPDNQIAKMQGIGDALRQIIEQDPTQMFLIEGHTDAIGSDLSNLALSDRRAETVAEILSYYYAIPPENLITQGYGEQFLKVPTTAAERENRRVAFRNITALMRTSGQ